MASPHSDRVIQDARGKRQAHDRCQPVEIQAPCYARMSQTQPVRSGILNVTTYQNVANNFGPYNALLVASNRKECRIELAAC